MLLPDLHRLYDRLGGCDKAIHPFVGAAFTSTGESELRLMAIGINAYVDLEDKCRVGAASFGEWFANGEYPYQRAAWKTLDVLARELVSGNYGLEHLSHTGKRSVYLTNAIKTYLSTTVGKRAEQIGQAQYDAHLPTFREELRVLAENGAFPHAIVVIGAPFWGRSCDILALGASFGPARIVGHSAFPGRLLHHANRLTVENGERTSTVWHLRVRHPAARSRKGSPEWLFAGGELARR